MHDLHRERFFHVHLLGAVDTTHRTAAEKNVEPIASTENSTEQFVVAASRCSRNRWLTFFVHDRRRPILSGMRIQRLATLRTPMPVAPRIQRPPRQQRW